jgi:hypothetical protein
MVPGIVGERAVQKAVIKALPVDPKIDDHLPTTPELRLKASVLRAKPIIILHQSECLVLNIENLLPQGRCHPLGRESE